MFQWNCYVFKVRVTVVLVLYTQSLGLFVQSPRLCGKENTFSYYYSRGCFYDINMSRPQTVFITSPELFPSEDAIAFNLGSVTYYPERN